VNLLVVEVVRAMVMVLIVRLVDSDILQRYKQRKEAGSQPRSPTRSKTMRSKRTYLGSIRDNKSSVSRLDRALGSRSSDGDAGEGEDGESDSGVDEHLLSRSRGGSGWDRVDGFRPAKRSWI
jgi:hypothetical protein